MKIQLSLTQKRTLENEINRMQRNFVLLQYFQFEKQNIVYNSRLHRSSLVGNLGGGS